MAFKLRSGTPLYNTKKYGIRMGVLAGEDARTEERTTDNTKGSTTKVNTNNNSSDSNKSSNKITGAAGTDLRKKEYDKRNWKYDHTISGEHEGAYKSKTNANKSKSKSISSTKNENNEINATSSGKSGLSKYTKLDIQPLDLGKLEQTTTNARSADYDIIRSKGRGRHSRLRTKLAKRQARLDNRVDNSLAKIEAKQQRKGTKYDAKMQANKLKNNGGVSTAEKNLNEFEKSINSPNQPVQKKTKQPGTAGSTLGESVNASKNGSVKTIKGRSIERSDIPKVQRNIKTSSVKVPSTVELDGGALIESRGFKPIETTTKSLTSIASGNSMKKPVNTIKNNGSGPRAEEIKVKSGPTEREKFIMNTYNNIRK